MPTWMGSMIITADGKGVTDEGSLLGFENSNPPISLGARQLLWVEYGGNGVPLAPSSYAIVRCFPLYLDFTARRMWLDLRGDTIIPSGVEGQTIRQTLINISWEAWCRAEPEVRELLGADCQLISLADAAVIEGVPLTTLARAAREGRLPTISHTAGRHLVYLSTIEEARRLGRLRGKVGRPVGWRKRNTDEKNK